MRAYFNFLLLFLAMTISLQSYGQITGNNVKVLNLTNNAYTSGASFFVKYNSHPQIEVDTFYTFECWMYVDTRASGDYPIIMDRRAVFSLFLIALDSSSSGGDYRIRFVARDNSDNIIASVRSSGKNAGSTDYQTDFHKWYHVAVSRDATTTRLFINGTLVDESTDTNFILSTSVTEYLNYGARYWGSYERFIDAAFDEFRYSDIARYTSSFSISVYSAPHDTTGDPHTILLFNFDNSDFTNTTSANSYTALYHGTPGFIDWDDAGLDEYLPLPIKYIEPLSAKEYEEDKVILNWATATEENNDGFKIERSENGIEWQNIGFVKGAGNSILTQYYSFVDSHPNAENYYRLKQLDYDGKFYYSNQAYYSLKEKKSCTVYPNPCSDFLQIKGLLPHRKTSAIIYNAQGQFVKASPSPAQIDIQELPKGVYFIEIIHFNSKSEVLRFIKN